MGALNELKLRIPSLRSQARGQLTATVLALSLVSIASAESLKQPIILEDQGSFAVGGTVIETPGEFSPTAFPAPPEGQTLHGDHAYIQYQIPIRARKYPLVMWHGGGQSGKTWETTADGRDGFKNIFVRRGFSIYIIDQPRRGRAGTSTEMVTIPALTQDQFFFNLYRLGEWPNFFPGVQFPQDKESLNQYYRQMTPDDMRTEDPYRDAAVIAELLGRIGEATLVTHSASGGRGWLTRLKSDKVKAIVNYEGVRYAYPEGEVPQPIVVPQIEVPLAEFKKLTTIPIQVVFGDNIPQGPEPASSVPLEAWRQILVAARHFVDKVNEHGGDAELLHLPEIGITGNTHFPFSDLNNKEIADLLSEYLEKKRLDGMVSTVRAKRDAEHCSARCARDDRKSSLGLQRSRAKRQDASNHRTTKSQREARCGALLRKVRKG